MPDLPEPIAAACQPLFDALPLENAMGRLLGSYPEQTALLEQILQHPTLQNRPELAAGLWLYVSDLDRSHTISQSLDDATGSYWHGIMHRREGDFSNSHYWLRRAATHPLLHAPSGLDSDRFIDEVAAAKGQDVPALVTKQREEWAALFTWCANNP